ncbi:MAG TPA: HlyD family secretion protein [Mizugakiibacter sp.]
MRKPIILKALAGLAAVAALALTAAWWLDWRHIQTTDDAYVKADNVVISPKVRGYVADVGVRENQHVRQGEVLVTLDREDYVAARDKAEAAVQSAAAALQVLLQQHALASAQVAQAQAAVTAARARAVDADRRYARDRNLIAQNFIARDRLDADEAAAHAADADVSRAASALQAALNGVKVVEAQHAQAEASLAERRAELAAARIDLAHTVIRAPLDGIVGNRSVQTGDYVEPGSQLFTLVPERGLYVVANFKETQVARMRPGQVAQVRLDVNARWSLRGVVESIAPATGSEFALLPPQNATGNFTKIVQRLPVKIELAPDSGVPAGVRPGLSAVVSVDTRL